MQTSVNLVCKMVAWVLRKQQRIIYYLLVCKEQKIWWIWQQIQFYVLNGYLFPGRHMEHVWNKRVVSIYRNRQVIGSSGRLLINQTWYITQLLCIHESQLTENVRYLNICGVQQRDVLRVFYLTILLPSVRLPMLRILWVN